MSKKFRTKVKFSVDQCDMHILQYIKLWHGKNRQTMYFYCHSTVIEHVIVLWLEKLLSISAALDYKQFNSLKPLKTDAQISSVLYWRYHNSIFRNWNILFYGWNFFWVHPQSTLDYILALEYKTHFGSVAISFLIVCNM